MVRMLTAAAALTIAGSALAVPQGAFWTEVDNSAGFAPDLTGPTSSLTGFRTFDLFVQLEAGDVVTAADFGIAGPNSGLSTNQSVYNHPAGGDAATGVLGFNANVVFDTFLAMGNLDGTAGQISVQSFDISDLSAIVAVWNPNAPGGFTEALPDGGNVMHLARFSVTSAGLLGDATGDGGLGETLGGQLFLSGEGPNGTFGREIAANGVVDVPNAFPPVPTPGAMALFGLAGAAATRRRR